MKIKFSSLFLPIENYTIRTKLSEETIIRNLKEVTHNSGRKSKSSWFGLGTAFVQKGASKYEGIIEDNQFKINRVISYRNSFLPVIKGSVSSFMNQREIKISMGLTLFVKAFMIFWLSVTFIASFFVIYRYFNEVNSENTLPFRFLPLTMAASGYLIMMLAFKFESFRSRRELDNLFEAETGTDLA